MIYMKLPCVACVDAVTLSLGLSNIPINEGFQIMFPKASDCSSIINERPSSVPGAISKSRTLSLQSP